MNSTSTTRRSLASASQLRRILEIDRVLDAGRLVNAASLAQRLGVTERTCKRDIEALRRDFQAPIVWDAGLRSYRYTAAFDLVQHARLTAEEAVALVLARKTFAAWGGTQLALALENALGKLTDLLSDHASIPLADIASLISEPPQGGDEGSGIDHFPLLLEAIRQRRPVRLRYRKPDKTQVESRTVHPLHLALLERRWILVALDPTRRAPRKFVLSRIRKAETAEGRFDPPPDFDPHAYLGGSFGHFTGDHLQSVRIRILPTLAPYIAERRWHPSQSNDPQSDGSLLVRFQLSSLEDIRRWILSWGGRAEALEPPELRESVIQEVQEAQSRYGP